MNLKLAVFSPGVGIVVVVRVAEKNASRRFMDYDANIAARSQRPEIFVPYFLQPVKLEAGVCRVHLRVKGGLLDQLLFVGSQLGQTGGESIGYAEFHKLYSIHLHCFVAKMVDIELAPHKYTRCVTVGA
jgi:hypothetical protein